MFGLNKKDTRLLILVVVLVALAPFILNARLKEQMLRRVEAVVYKLAQDRDLAFVFEVGADSDPNVLYANASVNLTSAAVAGYKKAFKNKPFEVRKAPPSLPSAAGGRK